MTGEVYGQISDPSSANMGMAVSSIKLLGTKIIALPKPDKTNSAT